MNGDMGPGILHEITIAVIDMNHNTKWLEPRRSGEHVLPADGRRE